MRTITVVDISVATAVTAAGGYLLAAGDLFSGALWLASGVVGYVLAWLRPAAWIVGKLRQSMVRRAPAKRI